MAKKSVQTQIKYKVGFDGPQVKLLVYTGDVEMLGMMPPAQAREIAYALRDAADRVEQWEGIAGHARRDVAVFPQVQHLLRAERG